MTRNRVAEATALLERGGVCLICGGGPYHREIAGPNNPGIQCPADAMLALVAELEEGLEQIKEQNDAFAETATMAEDERDAVLYGLIKAQNVGHNDDCIFCGFKDRYLAAALAREPEGEPQAPLVPGVTRDAPLVPASEPCPRCGDILSHGYCNGCGAEFGPGVTESTASEPCAEPAKEEPRHTVERIKEMRRQHAWHHSADPGAEDGGDRYCDRCGYSLVGGRDGVPCDNTSTVPSCPGTFRAPEPASTEEDEK